MKSTFFLIFFSLVSWALWSQPVNDNCSGLIDLGTLPSCNTSNIYTNVGASASNIGFGNNPSCFNGGAANRDVWFAFTVGNDFTDVTITVLGTASGPNGQPIGNPQIALYRGDCELDGLAELACISAADGSAQVALDVLGLTPGVTYYLRINDYSASAAPNAGDFTLCVDEYVPAINIGTSPGSSACFGTLYDSGGPDADYGGGENHTFVICPSDFHECIIIDLLSFATENGFDRVNFFAGNSTSAPLIASATGVDNGNEFEVFASSQCVTVQFISDGSLNNEGFELTWSCSPLPCGGSSETNPFVIDAIPFSWNGNTTCGAGSTFATSPCSNDAFLNGPEFVYTFNSPGNICASINITGAAPGTGVIVLDGPPSDPNTTCIATSPNGVINNANFQQPGTYYIVVANAQGCTNFNISIQPTECVFSAGLADVLCNPLNGCIEEGGVPSIFNFEDGFQDMPIATGVNNGCWFGVGIDPSFYWFTIEAQAAGPFGFIVSSADVPSDIDFNVWGPFTSEQVCESPQQVIQFITNNQPIRSSYAGGTEPTGLADVHPAFGYAVTDTYDCNGTGPQNNDDIVSTIQCQQGEVYVVLVNDWGNQIVNGGILVDWGPSNPAVLAPIGIEVVAGDTAVCSGETVQLEISSSVENISWIDPSGTLSCNNCLNPVASPTETTVYKAVVDAVCYLDTLEIRVEVFNLELGPDLTVCRGEEFVIVGGDEYSTASYLWQPPTGLNFSCLDCPNPTVTASQPGVYAIPAVLTAAFCQFQDTVVVTVLQQQAPEVPMVPNTQICEGDDIALGGTAVPGVTYNWVSSPIGFTSADANPVVSPLATTTYYLTTTNGLCPLPSVDSVVISVVPLPIVDINMSTTICQGDSIQLSGLTPESGVIYQWSGGNGLTDIGDPNTFASPTVTSIFTLQADRLGCIVSENIEITVTEISVDLTNADTTTICQGQTVQIQTSVSPVDQPVIWSVPGLSGTNFPVTPAATTEYIASVSIGSCFRADTIIIQVDSIPADLGFTLEPQKDVYCQGDQVIITSPIYDPALYPDIEHRWIQGLGQLTPDSLYNMVFAAEDTSEFVRITRHRGCIDTARILIRVIEPILPRIEPADTVICFGGSVSLRVVHNPSNAVTYEWQDPTAGLSCINCPNPTANPPGSIGYRVRTQIDGNCPEEAFASIIVNPLPFIQLIPPPIICLGDAIPLLASNPEPDATYVWTNLQDTSFRSTNPLLSVSPTATTTYRLQATNGCGTVESQVQVVVIGDTELNILGDLTICPGAPLNLQVEAIPSLPASTLANTVWTWQGGTATGATLSLVPGTTTTYTATVSLEQCGTATTSATVQVLAPADVSIAAARDTVFSRSEVALTLTTTPPTGNTIVWTPAPGSQSGDVYTFTAPENPDTTLLSQVYQVQITTAEGCTATDEIIIYVKKPRGDIPNIFSPNSDSKNDVFRIFNAEEISNIRIMVYNRWGQLVYESTDNVGWDGNYKGDPAPADVYIYRVQFTIGGETFDETGEVTLVR